MYDKMRVYTCLGETGTVSAVESLIAPSLGPMIEAEMSAGDKQKTHG